MKISNGKFTAKHAIIFSVNSHFGPDIFGFLDMEGISFYFYMFFHGYGWILAAFIVAIPWWRAAQYQMDIDIPKRVFNIQKREEGDPLKMEYLVVYCLVAGGGIMHLFVDLIAHPPFITFNGTPRFPGGAVWFGGDLWFSQEWMLSTGMFPCGNMLGFTEFYIFFGILSPILFIFGLFIIPRNNGKNYGKFLTIVMFLYYIPLLIAYLIPDTNLVALTNPDANYFGYMGEGAYYGSSFYLSGGESDLGVTIYFILFLMVPFMFINWSINGIPFLKKKQEAKTQKSQGPENTEQNEVSKEVPTH